MGCAGQVVARDLGVADEGAVEADFLAQHRVALVLVDAVGVLLEDAAQHRALGQQLEHLLVAHVARRVEQHGVAGLLVGPDHGERVRVGDVEGQEALAHDEPAHRLGVGGTGDLDDDLVVALAPDRGLGEAELVDAVVQHLQRPAHVVLAVKLRERLVVRPLFLGHRVLQRLLQRGEIGLDDDVHAAAQVEAELQRARAQALQAGEVRAVAVLDRSLEVGPAGPGREDLAHGPRGRHGLARGAVAVPRLAGEEREFFRHGIAGRQGQQAVHRLDRLVLAVLLDPVAGAFRDLLVRLRDDEVPPDGRPQERESDRHQGENEEEPIPLLHRKATPSRAPKSARPRA